MARSSGVPMAHTPQDRDWAVAGEQGPPARHMPTVGRAGRAHVLSPLAPIRSLADGKNGHLLRSCALDRVLQAATHRTRINHDTTSQGCHKWGSLGANDIHGSAERRSARSYKAL
jgi:hypothetical protein